MHNFKIGINFVKHLKKNYSLALFDDDIAKVIRDMQRFDQQINYNYTTRFKFWLSLYPLLVLTYTPFESK